MIREVRAEHILNDAAQEPVRQRIVILQIRAHLSSADGVKCSLMGGAFIRLSVWIVSDLVKENRLDAEIPEIIK